MHLLDIRVAFTIHVYYSSHKIEHKNLLSRPLKEISGVVIKSQIIGDSAFSNQNWIIKPYPNAVVLTPTKRRLMPNFVEFDV